MPLHFQIDVTYGWVSKLSQLEKKSLKRPKKSIRRSKKLNLIKKSQFKLTFLITFDYFGYIFDLFQSISNFSIKSGHVLIDFIATIDLDSKNSDQKFV